MQITAFKEMLVQSYINVKGCKDYNNTFARCGCKALIKRAKKMRVAVSSYPQKQSQLYKQKKVL